mmetsp:Transcript_22434/g.46874  ORF Transcript_22434/g.46874 Transcript_22434/m.46874 type:complete len:487 (+) Transcript_22434:378-1838(+)
MQVQDSLLHCATKIDVGSPPHHQGWQGFEFQIHNFEHLSTTINRSIDAHFSCLGHNWIFRYYPGGKATYDSETVGSLVLVSSHEEDVNSSSSSSSIEVKMVVTTRYGYGTCKGIRPSKFGHKHVRTKKFTCCRKTTNTTNTTTTRSNNNKYRDDNCCSDFQCTDRQKILANQKKYLKNGTLTMLIYMQQTGVKKHQSSSLPYVPKNPFNRTMLKMLSDEKSSDVLFEIGEKENTPTTTNIHAHFLILQACAPILADLCLNYQVLEPIPITDVTSTIFRALLRYVYGGEVPSKLLEVHSKEIIEVANKYGVINLKVEAEAAYVQSTTITTSNVVHNLYFADTMKCALLKEKVMYFLIENGAEVFTKISFNNSNHSNNNINHTINMQEISISPQTMFHDFLAAMAMGKRNVDVKDYYYDCDDDPSKLKMMSIDTLRRKLSDRGLDNIDGTREMLVSTLLESYANSGGGSGGGTGGTGGSNKEKRSYCG